jgi:hypothetical protein
LTVLEQVLEVGFSIVAIRALKSHPVSRSIYNAIITFLLTELHCGVSYQSMHRVDKHWVFLTEGRLLPFVV